MSRLNKMLEEQQKLIEKYGYVTHCVILDHKMFQNIHTHGLTETYEHYDLELVLKINPTTANHIIQNIIQKYIKYGEGLYDGQILYNIIENYPILIKEIEYIDYSRFRVILPDSAGNFPSHPDCIYPYNMQSAFEISS